MKAKINIKFVVILLSVAVVFTGVVGAVWYIQTQDASRDFKLGDELYAKGEYESASAQYARGIRKEPANREYLRKYQETLLKIQPSTSVDARDYFERYITSLGHAVQYHSRVADYHIHRIQVAIENAQTLGMLAGRAAQRSQWQQVVSFSNDMLDRLPETDPDRAYGYLYRGWATVELVDTVSDEDLDDAIEDLKTFLEHKPEHDRGWETLARAQFTLGEHFRTKGQRRKGDRFMEDYFETVELARETVPDGPHVRLAYARHISRELRRTPDDTILADYASDVMDRLHETALRSDDPAYIHGAATVLLSLRDIDRIRQAFDLYDHYIERTPNAHVHRHVLASLHYRLDELDPAERLFREILEAEALNVSLMAQMQDELRRHASASLVDIAHKRWQRASVDEREQYVELTEERHGQLREYVTDPESDPLMLRADAKRALVNRDYHTAADRLERLIRSGAANAEVYSQAALALERIGQLGLAHERMSGAIEAMPAAMPSLLYNKAQFELRLGRFEEADNTVSQLREVLPDDPRVAQLARTVEQQLSGEAAVDPDDADLDPATRLLTNAQRQYNEGELDSARAIVQQGYGEFSDDFRFPAALARIELLAGDRQAAREYLDQAIELAPDNRQLRRLEATLTTDDPVEAIHQYMAVIHDGDDAETEAERVIDTLLAVEGLRQQHAGQKESAEERGDVEAVEAHEQLVRQFTEEADRLLDIATELKPNEPRIIEYRMNRAIRNQAWNQAEQLLDVAAEVNADRYDGLLFRGVYLLERGRYAQAVRTFQDATNRSPYSSQAWRGLGMAYSRVGNLREARRAFEQSHRINPNDLNTVREFMNLLERAGDEARALRIAQNSRRIFPDNEELHDYWLELEGRIGDQTRALAERRELYEENPENRRNAMRLALFLTRNNPADHLILDSDGERRYSARRWRLLSTSEQQRAIEEERQRWRQEVDEIVADIYDRHGRDLETAVFEATIHRHRDEVQRGERVLREFIDGIPADRMTVSHQMALAQYLLESGQHERALETMNIARQYQDPEQLEADLAIANLRFMLNDYAGAKELFKGVYEVNPDQEIALRLAESFVHLGEIEQAREQLNEMLHDGGRNDRAALVEAMIARGEAQTLTERGEVTAANEKLDEHYRLIEEAAQGMPTNPAPHIIRAQSKIWEYRRNQRMSLLDEARRSLGRAEELAPDDSRITFMRVDVLRAEDDIRSAIREVNRLIDRSPMLTRAHQLRLQLFVEARDLDGAVEAARKSAETFSESAVWHEQYARLLIEAERPAPAADAMRRAFELGRTPARLAQYIDLEMRAGRGERTALLGMLNTHEELVESSLRLQGYRATLAHQTGNEASARQMVHDSYSRLLQAVEAGSRTDRDLQSWFNAHSVYFRMLSPVEAEQFLLSVSDSDQPRTLDSMHFFELAWLGRMWATSGQDGISRAIELMERAEAEVPRDLQQVKSNLLFELGNYQIVMQDYSSAVQNLERVVELSPTHATARNNLAFILVDRFGEVEKARPHAEQAYELSPDNPSVLDTLGWVRFHLGQYDRAESLIRESLELQDSASSRVHLARVMIETNREAFAVEHLEQAMNLNPNQRTREEIERLMADIGEQ